METVPNTSRTTSLLLVCACAVPVTSARPRDSAELVAGKLCTTSGWSAQRPSCRRPRGGAAQQGKHSTETTEIGRVKDTGNKWQNIMNMVCLRRAEMTYGGQQRQHKGRRQRPSGAIYARRKNTHEHKASFISTPYKHGDCLWDDGSQQDLRNF